MLVATMMPSTALAEPSIDQCIASSEAGQRERDAGQYLAARRSLAACTASTCPPAIARDCAAWLGELERSVPSIIVSTRDDRGADILGARISVDDMIVERSGSAIALDPGEHTITAEAPGHAVSRTGIVVLTGEKNRIVIARLAKLGGAAVSPPDASARDARPSLLGPAILGGAGVLSLGGSLVLGLGARSDLADAKDSPCAATRSCSEDDGRSIDRRLVIADVLLGVGVAALASAAAWFFFQRSSGGPRSVNATSWLGPARVLLP